MSTPTSSLSILTNIFTSPDTAFKDMQQTYPVLLPLAIISIVSAILMYLSFSYVDFSWYIEQVVESTYGDKSKMEQETAINNMEMMGANTYGLMFVALAIIGSPIIFSIISLYYVIVSNITDDGFQFTQWLSFISWSFIPSIVSAFATLVFVLTSDTGQFLPGYIDPLSLNELFFGMDPLKGLGSIYASLSLTTFWTIALLTIGYGKWTKCSTAKSFSIVILPYAVYYGALFLML